MIDLSAYAKTVAGKEVAVFGLGTSGVASAQALQAAGVRVVCGDDSAAQIQDAERHGFICADFKGREWDGVAALVLAPGVPLNHPVYVAARRAQVEVLSDIELLHRARHGRRTIGITGTNGKSTTTALTAHVLTACGIPAVVAGNIGVPALSIALPPEDGVIVMELSSFQLDLCPSFAPDIAVHLNVTPDHLDRHGSMENYVAAKERIFRDSGIGLCSVDDDLSWRMFDRAVTAGKRRMIPVSCLRPVEGGLYLDGEDLVDLAFEGGLTGSLGGLPTLRGRHNMQNAMMAYGAARAAGCDTDDILDALMTYPGLPHRQFQVRDMNGVLYVNDSKATNADATEKALLAFNDIYWIAGGLPKAGGLSGLERLAARVRRAFLIGQATPEFARWMEAQNIPFEMSGAIETAVQAAHDLAQSDVRAGMAAGVVLLSPACASYDQFKSFAHRGDVFTRLVNAL